MINYTAIRSLDIRRHPFTWGFSREVFSSKIVAARIRRSFPMAGFEVYEYSNGNESLRLERLILDRTQLQSGLLHPLWGDFKAELTSPAYLDGLSEQLGRDLTACRVEVSLRRYNHRSWLAPHCDLPTKLATQLFYLNTSWRHEWGGCLRILRSFDPGDFVEEILPLLGSSVVLLRAEDSWHCVTPVTPSAPARLSVQASFFR